MKRVVLTCLLLCGVAHADDVPGVQLQLIELKLPDRPLRRRVGIALLATSVAMLAHGFLFLGLAKHANDGVLANGQYHPAQENRRSTFEYAQTAFFIGAVVTFVPGMVLMWDR